MKKNLIKGMVALCVCAAFASCSKDVAFDADYANKQKEASYEEEFIKQFGPISPTQSWDFTKQSSATTRAEESAYKINQLPNDLGTGDFRWIWESGDPSVGEMNNAEISVLFSNKDLIRDEVDKKSEITWNPSNLIGVYFRLFAVYADDARYSYKRIGIGIPGKGNYWLAQMNPSQNYWVTSNTNTARPRYIDFTKLPEGTVWFKISQASTTQNNPIKASEHKLETFKEVPVVINNKVYTFWAFDTTNNGVSDLILWVKPVEKEIVSQKRYMAEDLGGVGDVDFNDIVFDMVQSNDDKQMCYVRALGGTKDIAILVNNKEYWRKSLDPHFAVEQMYNTGYENTPIGYHDALAEFEVSGWDYNANNVSIAVYGDGSAVDAEIYINFPLDGAIPRMVAVDVRKYWQKEKVRINSMNWFTMLDE